MTPGSRMLESQCSKMETMMNMETSTAVLFFPRTIVIKAVLGHSMALEETHTVKWQVLQLQ